MNPASIPDRSSKCETPTTDDGSLKGIARVAVEMRQALDECNKRNGY